MTRGRADRWVMRAGQRDRAAGRTQLHIPAVHYWVRFEQGKASEQLDGARWAFWVQAPRHEQYWP
jgi:hypothetical protein